MILRKNSICALFSVVISVWFACSASGQSSFIDDLREAPVVVCSDVPVLERLKYNDCVIQYFQTDMPNYLGQLELARTERIKAEQDRVWDWLELLPKPNCENVPANERPKFFFHCDRPDFSTDLVSSLLARLESLKADRNMMALRIDELRVKYDELMSREKETVSSVAPVEIEALSQTLKALDKTLVRVVLLEQLSESLADAMDLPPMKQLAFAEVSAGVPLFDARDVPLGEIPSSEQTVIKIETARQAARNIIIVHSKLGLGYTSKNELDAE